MGVIRQLKNFFTGKIIYPKTLTKAVYDENGERLDKILRDTMLAVDSEEYNGVEPRDADTLGGKYKAKDISNIEDKLTTLNSSLNGFSFRKNSEGEKEVSTDGGSTWENFSSGATLLWSNPNPNSSFAAQTIPIDLTGYDYILVTSKGKINSTSETFIKVLCKIGDGGNNFLPSPIQDANYGGYLRGITDITSNGLTFHDCYNRASIDNNGSIPYQIFGIKNFPISI